MSKPYYADYVNHIMRFYVRYNPAKGFKNEVDKLNYTAADRVFNKLSNTEKNLINYIYTQENINLSENINLCANKFNEDDKKIWSFVSNVTATVAKERRLL